MALGRRFTEVQTLLRSTHQVSQKPEKKDLDAHWSHLNRRLKTGPEYSRSLCAITAAGNQP
jgi:hypothetical protein